MIRLGLIRNWATLNEKKPLKIQRLFYLISLINCKLT